MKENVFKGIVAAVLGGLSAYFGVIAIPPAYTDRRYDNRLSERACESVV